MSPNHREAITAVSTITGKDEYLTSTNGALNTTGGGGGGGDVQYTDGSVSPAHPVGTIPVFNNAGTITAVSVANPLPVNASVTISGVATASNQTSGAQKTQIVDGSGNVIASTSNALNTSITNASIAVTGTFFQATQPISGTVAGTGNFTVVNGGTFAVQNTAATPAGTNVIGHVITDTGSTTAVTGNVTATQATGTNLHTVIDSGTITATPPALPAAPKFGQQAVTGTVATLAANALVNGVIIEALSTNTVSVFVGGTGVTATTGIELLPGGSTSVAVANTSAIGVITATGSATVTFIGS